MSSSTFNDRTATLEWKVTGLKEIFESSKGTNKSQVIKSDHFGNGQWQVRWLINSTTPIDSSSSSRKIFFYANSGGPGTHISLYLAAEPTLEEKKQATAGQSSENAQPIQSKEAFDHLFSYKTPNWGWSEFATRNAVYYNAPKAQGQDSFLIVCKVTEPV
ncbi:hypothetical protein FRC07_008828 [Ceratobasidium sp. 392]|nr:hypothetical protein FRC07_008828 [Ceratobasidium sp. 392]